MEKIAITIQPEDIKESLKESLVWQLSAMAVSTAIVCSVFSHDLLRLQATTSSDKTPEMFRRENEVAHSSHSVARGRYVAVTGS